MANTGHTQSADEILRSLSSLEPAAKRYVISGALKPSSTEEVLEVTTSVTLDAWRTIDWDKLHSQERMRLGQKAEDFVSDAAQTLPESYQWPIPNRIRRNLGLSELTRDDPEARAQARTQEHEFQLRAMAEKRISSVIRAFIVVFVLITIALLGAVVWKPESAQYVATIFTSLLGILAGFISGRSTSPGASTGPSANTSPGASTPQPDSPQQPHHNA